MPPVECTETIRESPRYGSRADTYESSRLSGSMYTNYADGTTISLFHRSKTYMRRTGPKGPPPAEQAADPRARIRKALAGVHKKLGRRTIDGVETGGIEPATDWLMSGNQDKRAGQVVADSVKARRPAPPGHPSRGKKHVGRAPR